MWQSGYHNMTFFMTFHEKSKCIKVRNSALCVQLLLCPILYNDTSVFIYIYQYILMSSQAREALALKKGRLEEDVQDLEKRVRTLLPALYTTRMSRIEIYVFRFMN